MADNFVTQVITVKEAIVEDGQYGKKCKITDSTDKVWRIAEKHNHLWPIFLNNIGAGVKVTVTQAPPGVNWKSFVSSAEVVGVPTPTPTPPPQPPPPAPQANSAPPPAPVNNNTREASIEAQVAAKCLGEVIAAGKIEPSSRAYLDWLAWCELKIEAALPAEIVELIKNRTKPEPAKKPAKPEVK